MKSGILFSGIWLVVASEAVAQTDAPYARFGYEGKVLRTPQERLQRLLLRVPNPDTVSAVAQVGLDPANQRYYLFSKDNRVLKTGVLGATEVARFLSVDPLARSFAWNSTYAFAENDVIRSIDLDGLEKLIVTNINQASRTATITIAKDIELVNDPNLPAYYQNINSSKINKLYAQGNVTLYTTSLPTNGQPLIFTSPRAWKKQGAYRLDVVYDVNAALVQPGQQAQIDGNGGRVSTVFGAIKPFVTPAGKLKPDTGARSVLNDEGAAHDVELNPGYNGKLYPLSPEEILVHEVGFHNMVGKNHPDDGSGHGVYPLSTDPPSLDQPTPGKVYPSEADTKQILNNNLQKGRLVP
jgi:hypothetical protein